MDLRGTDLKGLDSRRVAAVLIDLAVFAPVQFVAAQYDAGTIVLGLALWLIYFFLCDVTTGQTVGKALLGLRTVTVHGDLPSPRAASARTILRLIDHSVVGLVVMVASGGRRQRLGDLAAGTVVVRADEVVPLPRPLPRTVLAWPVLWLAPALGLFWLSADGRLAGDYRAQAEAICAEANAATRAVGTPAEWLAVTRAQVDALSALDAPPNWEDRHDALVASASEILTLAQDTYSRSVSRRSLTALHVQVEGTNTRLRAMGFEECGGSA